MKMKYQTIIFDLDGTLLDTLEDLTNSVNFALESMGYPRRTLDEVRSFVGNGVALLIERAVPMHTERAMTEKTLSLFKEHYAKHCEEKTRPYDGMIPLLDHLLAKDMQLAVVSNKIDSAVKPLCDKYFGKRILLALGEKEGIRKKPAPDSVLTAMSQLHASTETTVYIGDSDVDIQTAENAGVDCISVTWGFRDPSFLKENGAKCLVNTPEDLEKLLLL